MSGLLGDVDHVPRHPVWIAECRGAARALRRDAKDASMDPVRFDRLAETLATPGSRRGLLGVLLGMPLSLLGLSAISAKRHKPRHQRHDRKDAPNKHRARGKGKDKARVAMAAPGPTRARTTASAAPASARKRRRRTSRSQAAANAGTLASPARKTATVARAPASP
jgi:hypothetical protein